MDHYPYTNFHELNLVYFLRHFKEIFDQWASLYEEMTSWKASTTEDLDAWKAEVLGDIDQWETDLNAALALWKTDTETDISTWESATMAALEAWQTAFETLFSSTFSDLSDIKTAAEAAQAAAETAQAAAEAAAASVESSAAQITANANNIDMLKTVVKAQSGTVTNSTGGTANIYIDFHMFNGRSYTYSNNTSASVSIKVQDSSNQDVATILNSLSAGHTKTFICTGDNWDKIGGYFNVDGSCTVVSDDSGVFDAINDAATALAGDISTVTADVAVNAGKIEDLEDYDEGQDAQIKIALDALHPVTNLANPDDIEVGYYWKNASTTASSETYQCIEVPVKPLTTYTVGPKTSSFCFFSNDSDQNLGKWSDLSVPNPFTTPEGCTKVKLTDRVSSGNLVLVEGEWPVPVTYAEYPYGTIFSNLDALSDGIDAVDARVDAVEEYMQIPSLTSISMFTTMGVAGDSFSSGFVTGLAGADGGEHMENSWPQVLGRITGISATNYSKTGFDVSKFISNTTIGLPKLLSDPAKDLYVIFLGINAEKTLADPDVSATLGTTSDIDLSDPTQNADTFCGHYGYVISQILEHAPQCRIILAIPKGSQTSKYQAIKDIAALFTIPYIDLADDPYYDTAFYSTYSSGGHPILITYAGMALAFKRQIEQCMVDSADYFKLYPPALA